MRKQKVAKTFLVFCVDSHFACEILQNYLSWLIGVGKVRGTLLFAKAKSSKNFLDSTELQNRLVN